MGSERCAFRKDNGEGIRELVYREHPDKKLLAGFRYWFYDNYDGQLTRPFGSGWATESIQEIIDLWLYTQLAHTGPMNFLHNPQPNPKKPKKPPKKKQFSIADFNACDSRIGREKFEFLFRSSVGTIGHSYIQFLEILALPLFTLLRQQGMKPSFEAEVALKYNPYPDAKSGIKFDDVFWHQNRETPAESFHRILARQRFSGLGGLLRCLFETVEEGIEYIRKCKIFGALLKDANVLVLTERPEPGTEWVGRFNANSYPVFGGRGRTGSFEAFAGRKIRFYDSAQIVLRDSYIEFRLAFNEALRKQRPPDKWKPNFE